MGIPIQIETYTQMHVSMHKPNWMGIPIHMETCMEQVVWEFPYNLKQTHSMHVSMHGPSCMGIPISFETCMEQSFMGTPIPIETCTTHACQHGASCIGIPMQIETCMEHVIILEFADNFRHAQSMHQHVENKQISILGTCWWRRLPCGVS